VAVAAASTCARGSPTSSRGSARVATVVVCDASEPFSEARWQW